MGDSPGLKLLFVEDHADTANVMSRLMDYAGHKVTVATSIAEAQSACANASFDVLICDIQLPDGDGRELLEHIREVCPDVVGIVLSGHGQAADIAETRRAGFAEHLTKPVSSDVLLKAIERVRMSNLQTNDRSVDSSNAVHPI